MKKHLLMCCHNGEDFVREQIISIFKQTLSIDFYHIFNFGSTDNTLNILNDTFNEYGMRNLLLYDYDDAPGASLSFFEAFKKIGEIIDDEDCVFVADQDDIWHPDKVELIIDFYNKSFLKNKKTAVFHDVTIVDSKLNTLSESFYNGDPYLVPRDLSLDRLILCNPVVGHTLLLSGYSIKMFNKEVTPDFYLMHDWALSLWISRFGNIEFFPGKALSLYRQHSNNVIGINRSRKKYDIIRRTRKFAKSTYFQALGFAKDLDSKNLPKYNLIDDLLIRSSKGKLSKIKVNIYMALLAAFRGPTIKRKLLFFFFIYNIFSK